MDRISTATKDVDLFGPGKHGFKNGNLALAIQPTALNAEFFNDLQEELLGLIEAQGLTPTAGVRTQIRQAIQLMIAGSTGNDFKASVRFATTANINLNGLATQAGGDWGSALTAGDRIFTPFQTAGADRGIWVAAAGAWTRATDADAAGELTPATVVAVEEGATLADSLWMLSTDGAITIGTTSLSWKRIDAGAATGSAKLNSVGATVNANALTVTIGAETLDFRSATLTSGTPVTRTAASQGSLTVPSGATLGMSSGVAGRLYWGWLDNAGALEPWIGFLTGGVNLDEAAVYSTTAIGGASNSANVLYSQTARASVAIRVRGFCDITEAAAGTWATPPTLVQPIGGQAGAALQSVGYGQSWSNPTRSVGTTYTNTTGRPIMVMIGWTVASGGGEFRINGVARFSTFGTTMGAWAALIPPGATYAAILNSGAFNTNSWAELS